jgi:hypothetical protein
MYFSQFYLCYAAFVFGLLFLICFISFMKIFVTEFVLVLLYSTVFNSKSNNVSTTSISFQWLMLFSCRVQIGLP